MAQRSPHTLFLGALLLFSPVPLVSIEVALDIVVNDGSLQTLRATVGDDLASAAAAFVAANNIENGAGCTADASCVAGQLLEALERQAVSQAAVASRGAARAGPPGSLAIAGEAAAPTLAPGLSLWSGAGWHDNGHPFAAHTPGTAVTARTEARLKPTRARLAALTANATVALAQLRLTAQRRATEQAAPHEYPPGVGIPGPPTESDFTVLEVEGAAAHADAEAGGPPRSLGGCRGPSWLSKVVLAIGVISAPGNLQV